MVTGGNASLLGTLSATSASVTVFSASISNSGAALRTGGFRQVPKFVNLSTVAIEFWHLPTGPFRGLNHLPASDTVQFVLSADGRQGTVWFWVAVASAGPEHTIAGWPNRSLRRRLGHIRAIT